MDFTPKFRADCAELGFDLEAFMATPPPTSWDKKLPTFIYVLRCGEFTKVGVAKDVKARVAGMQPHNPLKIEIVRQTLYPSKQQAVFVEQTVHRILEPNRVWHEWFRCDPADARRALNYVAAAHRQLLPIQEAMEAERLKRWDERYESNPALKAKEEAQRRKDREWVAAYDAREEAKQKAAREFDERTGFVPL